MKSENEDFFYTWDSRMKLLEGYLEGIKGDLINFEEGQHFYDEFRWSIISELYYELYGAEYEEDPVNDFDSRLKKIESILRVKFHEELLPAFKQTNIKIKGLLGPLVDMLRDFYDEFCEKFVPTNIQVGDTYDPQLMAPVMWDPSTGIYKFLEEPMASEGEVHVTKVIKPCLEFEGKQVRKASVETDMKNPEFKKGLIYTYRSK